MEKSIIVKQATRREEKIVRLLSNLEHSIATVKREIQAVSHPDLDPLIEDNLRPDVRADAIKQLIDGHAIQELLVIGSQAGDYKSLLDLLQFIEEN